MSIMIQLTRRIRKFPVINENSRLRTSPKPTGFTLSLNHYSQPILRLGFRMHIHARVFPLRHISLGGISFKCFCALLLLRRGYLKGKRKRKDKRLSLPDSENYTIFHALLETMTKKKEMDSTRHRFPGNAYKVTNLAALFLAASGLFILAWGIYVC